MRDSIALDSTRLQRLQQISLWDFALSLYAMPGVEAACLTLQDENDVDVCELLFHCWLYSCGLEVIPAKVMTIRRERCQWQQHVTEVLRGLRRDLKVLAAASDSVATLRQTIKQAELMAERENLQRWQEWILGSLNSEKKLRNRDEKTPNAAIWLRKQLFIADEEGVAKEARKMPAASLQALQTVACQLDPHQVAR